MKFSLKKYLLKLLLYVFIISFFMVGFGYLIKHNRPILLGVVVYGVLIIAYFIYVFSFIICLFKDENKSLEKDLNNSKFHCKHLYFTESYIFSLIDFSKIYYNKIKSIEIVSKYRNSNKQNRFLITLKDDNIFTFDRNNSLYDNRIKKIVSKKNKRVRYWDSKTRKK